MVRILSLVFVLLLSPAVTVSASSGGMGTQNDAGGAVDVLRSPDGRLRAVAVETRTPVVVDGAFDEDVWQHTTPVSGFVQSEPRDGEPATERTEVRLAYDRQNLYIAATLFDSEPGLGVVNEIRKDFRNDQDTFEVILDPFADRRNGFVFATNREGARADQQVANEGREINASWDAVWFVRTRQSEDRWTVEMALPFRSLRFERGLQDVWGINFSRRVRRKNEVDFWSPVPRAYNLARVSLAGDLTGLPAVSPGRNLQVKPYVLARTVRPTGRGTVFDPDARLGLDVKWGVTPALTLDLTANPDFAQVEADELQVNLTQFSQFYPEKRDFFIENSGMFYVGDAARNNRVTTTPTPDEDLLLFHSRRIGLGADGTALPIYGGARLTGRAGAYELGLLSLQVQGTEQSPGNNYTVFRARRNLRPGSDIGAIFMSRQSAESGADFNRVYGVDANVRFAGTTDWNSYVIRTDTPGIDSGEYAWRTSINREGNFFHGKGGLMTVGEGFNDEMGYYRRVGARKWFLDTGIRPRPAAWQRRGVREIHPHVVWNYYTDLDGRMVGKRLHSGVTLFFNNGGYTELSWNPEFNEITAPLRLASGVAPLAPGAYSWDEWQIRVTTDPSRHVSFTFTGIAGGLWSGTQRTVMAGVTWRPTARLRVNTGVTRTSADLGLPGTDFVTAVWTTRANYSFSTNMFLDSLLQYDQDRHRFNANLRFNFIHRPLSDLFVVFNDQEITNDPTITPGRSAVVKFTRMMAF
ncbi:MAG: carbohydrate binding family 9 domain-containing protein [Acidobacteria bacterium]|nr:carbohydrate binding family 9 domain-containing protein [Acidobacteriota bacterium]